MKLLYREGARWSIKISAEYFDWQWLSRVQLQLSHIAYYLILPDGDAVD